MRNDLLSPLCPQGVEDPSATKFLVNDEGLTKVSNMILGNEADAYQARIAIAMMLKTYLANARDRLLFQCTKLSYCTVATQLLIRRWHIYDMGQRQRFFLMAQAKKTGQGQPPIYSCIMLPSRYGLLDIISSNPNVVCVRSSVIYERDEVVWEEGTNPRFIHRPKLVNRGKPVAGYCVVSLVTGQNIVEVVTVEQMLQMSERNLRSGRNQNPDDLQRKIQAREQFLGEWCETYAVRMAAKKLAINWQRNLDADRDHAKVLLNTEQRLIAQPQKQTLALPDRSDITTSLIIDADSTLPEPTPEPEQESIEVATAFDPAEAVAEAIEVETEPDELF